MHQLKAKAWYFLTALALALTVGPGWALAASGASSDQLLKEMSGGSFRAISLDEFSRMLNGVAINLIRALNKIAFPAMVIIFILGVLAFVAGIMSGNSKLKGAGGGAALGAMAGLIIIRLAPVIMAAVEGMVK